MRSLLTLIAVALVSSVIGCCHDTCDTCRDICSSCGGHQAVHLSAAPAGPPAQQMPAPTEKK